MTITSRISSQTRDPRKSRTMVAPEGSVRVTKKRKWVSHRKYKRMGKIRGTSRFNRKSYFKYQLITFGVLLLFAMLPQDFARDSFGMAIGSERVEHIGRLLSTDDSCNVTVETPKNGTEEEGSLFPEDKFTMEQKNQGAIVLHIFAIIYMFIGLAIVCDEYFEASLSFICEDLQLKEDVAGATFMAAGGSAPELFTSIIGVFIATSDIGFGTIVGSATFNVLFVIAMCSFMTTNLVLSWWPLTRDCVFYCVSIVVLVLCVFDQYIDTLESVILLIMYGLYITVMYYNERLEAWVGGQVEASKSPRTGWRLVLYNIVDHDLFNYFIYIVILANVVVIIWEMAETESTLTDSLNTMFSVVFISEMVLKIVALSFFGYWSNGLNAFDGTMCVLILIELFLSSSSFSGGLRGLRGLRFLRMARALRVIRLYYASLVEKTDASTQTNENDWNIARRLTQQDVGVIHIQPSSKKSSSVAPISSEAFLHAQESDETLVKQDTTSEPIPVAAEANNNVEDDEDDEDEEPANPFELPDGGVFDKFMWALSFPLAVLMFFTIPDCRRPMFKKFYFLTFIMCIVWIGLMSYVMVWMATIFGEFAGISDPIMGLTLIAAGTSIPDLLSSVAVAKKGFGDMAVSSSVGSNIFDILIGLPVPWFIYTAIYKPGARVEIQSENMAVMVLTLFLMVAAVVSIIHWSNWIMTRKLGFAMLCLYAIFVAESLLLESGVLGGC
uniref:Uncharacterized protein n=1 Tax=Mucochytrium quahogii TaxID=96639 RepID=A0A7S2WRZ0_9STRA|mmetsp:Transcript_8182/g.17766  ORF Transcript_8182/g.17766 Transcript_8182/m.17766 type:complete len:724 (+) Transcript_8182:354-2525(+)